MNIVDFLVPRPPTTRPAAEAPTLANRRRWSRIGAVVIIVTVALLLLATPQRVVGVVTMVAGLALDAVGMHLP